MITPPLELVSTFARCQPFADCDGCSLAQMVPCVSPATHINGAFLTAVDAGAQLIEESAPPFLGFSSATDRLHFIEYVVALAKAGRATNATNTVASASAHFRRVSFEVIDSKKGVVLAARLADSAAKRAESAGATKKGDSRSKTRSPTKGCGPEPYGTVSPTAAAAVSVASTSSSSAAHSAWLSSPGCGSRQIAMQAPQRRQGRLGDRVVAQRRSEH